MDNADIIRIAIILAISAVVYLAMLVLERAVKKHYRIDKEDNLAARKVRTKVGILKNIGTFFLILLTAGAILMVFEPFRQIGTSIWASAGIIGLIAGFAAQKSLATVMSGVQIAFTQPIRIDDIIIVEGEWGKVEEINLTYVVMKTWDLRRLILPINHFLEKPFENWSRTNTELIGTVFLHVDYTAPVDILRTEFERIVAASPLWDGKTKVLQVTEVKSETLELRALVSAADASKTWDLRCEVREKLIAFLQERYPSCLPKRRAENYTPASREPSPLMQASEAKAASIGQRSAKRAKTPVVLG